MQPQFVTTSAMAKIIGYSKDWLDQRVKDGTLVEGVHFVRKESGHRRWKVRKMLEWMDQSDDPEADAILNNLIKGVA